jgi:hypothetical protein
MAMGDQDGYGEWDVRVLIVSCMLLITQSYNICMLFPPRLRQLLFFFIYFSNCQAEIVAPAAVNVEHTADAAMLVDPGLSVGVVHAEIVSTVLYPVQFMCHCR